MPDVVVILAAPAGFAVGGILAALAPRLLRRRAVAERQVIALASALVAVSAAGAPTGLSIADVAYKALFGGLVVYFGARADRRVILFSAIAASAAAYSSDILPLPLAAAGLIVGVMLTVRRTPLVHAVVAAAIVQTALRLDIEATGMSALASALVTVPLVVSGVRRSRPRQRRVARISALAVAGVAVLASVGAAIAAGLALRPIDEAISAASNGLDAARQGDAEASRNQFRVASAAFGDASDDVRAWWTAPSRLVPIVAQHVTFAREVTAGGQELAETGEATTAAADVERLQFTGGALDLDAVRALHSPLLQASASASEARDRFQRADSAWLLGPIRDRLERETRRITTAERDAERAARIVDRLPSMLGGEAPRRYFVLIHTPAESRALGGFVGSYGEVVADNGRLSLTRFGRTRELQTAGTPAERILEAPPDYVARYSRFDPAVTWQNVTMSPDGPTVAQVVASLYPQSGGAPIDGVIAIDPAGLAALLRVTGDVTVPPWPEPLTPDNAERILLVDQYVQLDDEPRENFLGDVAEEVVRRLTAGTLPRPAAIVDALAPAARSGNLAVMSLVEDDAALLRSLDLDLAVDPVEGDYVALVTQNASSNKIDTFLRRSIDYDVEIDDDHRLRATIAVTLHNEAPATGLPEYIIGNQLDPRLPDGSSRLYVSIYSPWGLLGATLDGQPSAMESEVELGRNVYSRYVDLGPGEAKTLTLEYTGQLDDGDVDGDHYLLDIRHQPGVDDDVSVSLDGEPLAQLKVTTDRRVRGPG